MEIPFGASLYIWTIGLSACLAFSPPPTPYRVKWDLNYIWKKQTAPVRSEKKHSTSMKRQYGALEVMQCSWNDCVDVVNGAVYL